MKHYKEISSEINFAKSESDVLEYWANNDTFRKSIEIRSKNFEKNDEFVFYDGPPFANGLPHYGHLLTGFIKDTFARYQTMIGKRVERRFGWDCHGLPAEMGAEKDLKISGKLEIEKFGIDKFNEYCRESVMKFSSQWEKYVNRQARWVDFKNSYKTMDITFMESIMWAFKELYNKGLVYESMKVVPYSWACETPLSNFETRLDNSYRKKESKATIVKFRIKNLSEKLINYAQSLGCSEDVPFFLLVWTTTPWTLPSNLMIAISTSIDYKAVFKDGEVHIAASSYLKDEEGLKIDADVLLGINYYPLFNYFSNIRGAFYVVDADFVTANEGTGIVHIAPGFGEDDFILCSKHKVEVVCPVDASGRFTKEVSDFYNMHVFDANDKIIQHLKLNKSIVKVEQYLHNYPHCWRTDTPLIYKAVSSWYIKVTEIKDKMIKLNQEVNWYPMHIRDGLFGNWLDNVKDWAISRNRFFGSPIPVWKSDNPKFPRVDVYGSIKELETDFEVKITDLHRHFLDNLVRPNPDDPSGKTMMKRVPDVLDCWFESGSMPFAQFHYPFENKEWFESNFPADFITEYIAQTRGWFYTLFVISTAIFGKAPFKNCVCHGVVLDQSGQKLSKRLNNYQDPLVIFDEYGSDALRCVMLSSSVMNNGNLLLDKEGLMLRDSIKLIMKPAWNALNFFITYANLSDIKAQNNIQSGNLMDVYILAKSSEIIADIKYALNCYDSATAYKKVEDYIEVLNNWYIRRNRERFLKGNDKQVAFNVLYSVLHNFIRLIAPLIPMLSEQMWQCLGENSSVHLQDYPIIDYNASDLVSKVDKVREICNVALSLRNKYNIRIRQPLQTLKIVSKVDVTEFTDVMKDEVNIKSVVFDDPKLLTFMLKLNLPLLGKRYPEKIKPLSLMIKSINWHRNEDGTLNLGDFILKQDEYILFPEVKEKYSEPLPSGDGLVYLDVNITDELQIEGLARDLVRFIQQARKEANLKIMDPVEIIIKTDDEKYIKAIDVWSEYIKNNTSSTNVYVGELSRTFFTLKVDDKLIIGVK